MRIQSHPTNTTPIAEIISETILLNNAEDALQLMADLYYQDFDKIIIHEKNIVPGFFDLKTGLAGAILQKCSNYRIRLAIVGQFSQYPGQSIKDFIYESNKGKQVNFLESVALAVERLSK